MIDRADPARDFERASVADLMLQHMTYSQIGLVLGLPYDKVKQYAFELHTQWKERALQSHDQWVEAELGRLDALERYIWQQVRTGNLNAVDRALTIMNRRAMLLGLDAPAKVDITTRVREMAREAGIDEEEAVREAERLVKSGLVD